MSLKEHKTDVLKSISKLSDAYAKIGLNPRMEIGKYIGHHSRKYVDHSRRLHSFISAMHGVSRREKVNVMKFKIPFVDFSSRWDEIAWKMSEEEWHAMLDFDGSMEYWIALAIHNPQLKEFMMDPKTIAEVDWIIDFDPMEKFNHYFIEHIKKMTLTMKETTELFCDNKTSGFLRSILNVESLVVTKPNKWLYANLGNFKKLRRIELYGSKSTGLTIDFSRMPSIKTIIYHNE